MTLTTHDFDKQLRETLRILLSQCTEAQQQFFLRLYPKGIEGIAYTQLNHAIMQCQRTIQHNKEKVDKKDELVESMQSSIAKVKQADIAISVTNISEVSVDQIKLPITKAKPEFKCCECGETEPSLQFMTSEYCFVCINK